MKKLAVFLVLPLLLWGCSWRKMPAGPMCRVVTQVRVTAILGGQVYESIYTDSDKMESVLCYLRLLQKGKKTDIDPDSFRVDSYEITVHYSDGQHTVYRQLHRDFLQTDGGAWHRVTAGKMELLFPESSSIIW